MTTSAAAAAANPDRPETRAYVTFLSGHGVENWKGVVGLAKGLQRFGSAYPLVVAVLPDVPEYRRRILTSLGCVVREVEPVRPSTTSEIQSTYAMEHYVAYYSKLRIWEFVQYKRMVYLDPRSKILHNIDELFEANGHLYAARSCNTDALVIEPGIATADSMVRELRLSVTPPTNLFQKHNVACQQNLHRRRLRARGGDAEAYHTDTASAGMGGSRWAIYVGLHITVVAVGAAFNFFPAAAGPCGLTSALIRFFLVALVLAGVNLTNAGVYLNGGGRADTLG